MNDRIRAREVRLIDPDGGQLGVKALPEAMSIARQLDLDLVEVAPDANPPVCRIMDYNRFKYEAAQRAKESRRKTTSTSIKEMKYRPKIGTGDFDTKTRQVARFLGEGHKVKVTIMFRGREMTHPELGRKILDHVAETVAEVAKVEAAPKQDGRNMIMVLAPDRRAQPAKPARPAGSAKGPATAAPVDSAAVQNSDAASPGPDPEVGGGGPAPVPDRSSTAAPAATPRPTRPSSPPAPAGGTRPNGTARSGSGRAPTPDAAPST